MSHGASVEELREVAAASRGPTGSDLGSVVSEQIFFDAVASATAGIWRFSLGDWSVVLKVLGHRGGGSPNWQSGAEEDHWYYWKREALAYSSGLLGNLEGPLRAPRCHGVFERTDGTVGLWLEDLRHAEPGTQFPLERYRSVAFALGQAQGALTVSGGTPHARWLAHQWLRRYVERRESFLEHLDIPGVWQHPLVVEHLRPDLAPDMIRIWEQRERLLAEVESSPSTLCHCDLHPGNVFVCADEIVLIDWAFVGVGVLGEDIGTLIFDAVFDFFVSPEDFPALADLLTDGYRAGLQAAGWTGEFELVLGAIRSSAAVKFFWILPSMLNAAAHGRSTLNRRPIAQTFASWAPVLPRLVEYAHLVT